MQKTRGELFDERRPNLTEAEIIEAAKAAKVIDSFNCLPVMTAPISIGALAVKFLLGDGTTTVMILDPHACATLRMTIEALDASGCRATITTPSGETQH
jgi:hypothetical protein